MTKYELRFSKSALKELQNLDKSLIPNIIHKIDALSNKPRPIGCKKIKGADNLWQIRIGSYRVIYLINDEKQMIDIMIIRHRKDIYKFL